MHLVIGLGNPGSRYAGTRHNIGFRVVDALAQRVDASFVRVCRRYDEARFAGPNGTVVLLKPMTYMNASGEALLAWLAAAGAEAATAALLVVMDDIHLPLGAVRIRTAGSAGGQKGLASILAAAGTGEVPRVRLGVGPREGVLDPAAWADYVLEDFGVDEQEEAAALVARGAEAVLACLETGPQAAAATHNRNLPVAD